MLLNAENIDKKIKILGDNINSVLKDMDLISNTASKTVSSAQEITVDVEEQNVMLEKIIDSFEEIEQLIGELNQLTV